MNSKMGFQKGDEREVFINYQAARISWIFMLAVLLLWSIYDLCNLNFKSIHLIVLGITLMIHFSTLIYFRKKYGN